MKKILFITTNNLNGKPDGGKIYSSGLLKQLITKYTVDIIHFENFRIGNKFIHKKKFYTSFFCSLFTRYPLLFIRYRSNEIIKYISLNSKNIDFIILDHIFPVLSIPIKYFKKTFLIHHNIEFINYYQKLKNSNFFLFLFLYLDYYKLKVSELKLLKKIDKIFFVSKNEYLQYKHFNEKSFYLPMLTEIPKIRSQN
jgi:hypothetical protein